MSSISSFLKFGPLSLFFSVVALLLLLLNASIVLLSPSFRMEATPTPNAVEVTPTPTDSAAAPDSPKQLPLATPSDLRFVLLVALSLGSNVLAFALGMGGLMQGGQNKAISVSGLTLSGLVFILYCCSLTTMIPVS